MVHLLAKRPVHVNVALLIAIVWAILAVGAAIYDIGHMLQIW